MQMFMGLDKLFQILYYICKLNLKKIEGRKNEKDFQKHQGKKQKCIITSVKHREYKLILYG